MFFNRGKDEKKGMAAALIAIAYADGHLDPDEALLVANTAEKLYGLSDREFKEVLQNPSKYAQNLPTSFDDQEALLRHMLGVAMIDGIIRPSESEMIHVIGGAMGIPDGLISELVSACSHRLASD